MVKSAKGLEMEVIGRAFLEESLWKGKKDEGKGSGSMVHKILQKFHYLSPIVRYWKK